VMLRHGKDPRKNTANASRVSIPIGAPATLIRLFCTTSPLCRLLRTDVLVAVEREQSALHRLCDEIRDYLFPHVTDAQFADIYAQTLTYALLLARLSGETDLTAAHAADRLDSGHGLLAQTLRILTQPAARAEIETPAALLERVIGAVDPDRLSRRGDPWLYFYEDFLAAYDPKLRKNFRETTRVSSHILFMGTQSNQRAILDLHRSSPFPGREVHKL
jgi:hypothetical protein